MATMRSPPVLVMAPRTAGSWRKASLDASSVIEPCTRKTLTAEKRTPIPEGGGKGDGRHAVEHSLDIEGRGVSRCSILNGADNDHGPRTVEKGSRDKPIHEGGGVGPGPLLQPVTDLLQTSPRS